MNAPATSILAATLAALRAELGDDPALAALAPGDLAALTAAAGGDAMRLKRWLKRRLAGEPLAHITGEFVFCGLPFYLDKRAYATDPEVATLVEAVVAWARARHADTGRAPLLAEIGVGCASIALAVKHDFPAAEIVGLELDSDALAVAARNVARHGLPVRLVESDLFDSWPAELPAPDLVFGDPPWGDASTLYSADRPAAHYQAMPPASAFPLGGRTGVHAQILRAIAARGWTCQVILNAGVLPDTDLHALRGLRHSCRIARSPSGLALLYCMLG